MATMGGKVLGQIWVPEGQLFLGANAGALLGKCTGASPGNYITVDSANVADDGVVETAPPETVCMAHELAAFFLQRLQSIGRMRKVMSSDPQRVFRALSDSRKSAPSKFSQLAQLPFH